MVNILITGSSGYLGENLILKLFKQKKYKITGIDIKPNKKTEGLIRFVNADISNGEALKQNLNNIDVICHCATLLHRVEYNTKESFKSTNIDGTMNIYNLAKENGVKKIVLTSSVGAISMDLRNQKWPVNENHISDPNNFGVSDHYGESKKSQEHIAKTFADKFNIQTIVLRPCAFFAVEDDHEIGFRLTGSYAVVDDIANAHVAAIDLLLDKQKSESINKFEIIFITNNLPYKDSDKRLIRDGNMRKIVSKYWPEGSKFIFELGYKRTIFSGVYDLSKAKKILNWEPSFNFNEWYNYCKEKNLTFENRKQKYKKKKSLKHKIFRFFSKIKKRFD